MKCIKTVLINGRTWKVNWEDIDEEDEALGLCYQTEHEIDIDTGLKNKRLLETIIHEILHPELPRTGEEKIDSIASDLANALWRIGYRVK